MASKSEFQSSGKSIAKLLTSNLLDFNHEKNTGKKQHFFPVYIQNFSGYSRLVGCNWKKNVGCSRGFFSQLNSSGLDVNISAHEFYG